MSDAIETGSLVMGGAVLVDGRGIIQSSHHAFQKPTHGFILLIQKWVERINSKTRRLAHVRGLQISYWTNVHSVINGVTLNCGQIFCKPQIDKDSKLLLVKTLTAEFVAANTESKGHGVAVASRGALSPATPTHLIPFYLHCLAMLLTFH
jgi:hypothetical protein